MPTLTGGSAVPFLNAIQKLGGNHAQGHRFASQRFQHKLTVPRAVANGKQRGVCGPGRQVDSSLGCHCPHWLAIDLLRQLPTSIGHPWDSSGKYGTGGDSVRSAPSEAHVHAQLDTSDSGLVGCATEHVLTPAIAVEVREDNTCTRSNVLGKLITSVAASFPCARHKCQHCHRTKHAFQTPFLLVWARAARTTNAGSKVEHVALDVCELRVSTNHVRLRKGSQQTNTLSKPPHVREVLPG